MSTSRLPRVGKPCPRCYTAMVRTSFGVGCPKHPPASEGLTLAQALTLIRSSLGVSQCEFGDMLGYGRDQSTVSMWENGNSAPRMEALHDLSSRYGLVLERGMWAVREEAA